MMLYLMWQKTDPIVDNFIFGISNDGTLSKLGDHSAWHIYNEYGHSTIF